MKARDLSVLAGVILIIIMLIIPLPPFLLDVLIIFNISLSLLILLVAISTKDALEFSIFPTMLLLVTLFRLGLSVSTTRSILGNAEAGMSSTHLVALLSAVMPLLVLLFS